MPIIQLTTFIEAPIEKVFDLSRSIDLHKSSMTNYKEEAVSGTTTGFINLNETVTWKANHLFKTRTLKIKITSLHTPYSFTDEQVDGNFKMMKHEHYFKSSGNGTIMTDKFHFESPYGIIGKLFNCLFLTKYMQRLLKERNKVIKYVAERKEY
jgi:ligand-binding SRPBCC domain-containing protein